jgi:hypothetical protein
MSRSRSARWSLRSTLAWTRSRRARVARMSPWPRRTLRISAFASRCVSRAPTPAPSLCVPCRVRRTGITRLSTSCYARAYARAPAARRSASGTRNITGTALSAQGHAERARVPAPTSSRRRRSSSSRSSQAAESGTSRQPAAGGRPPGFRTQERPRRRCPQAARQRAVARTPETRTGATRPGIDPPPRWRGPKRRGPQMHGCTHGRTPGGSAVCWHGVHLS